MATTSEVLSETPAPTVISEGTEPLEIADEISNEPVVTESSEISIGFFIIIALVIILVILLIDLFSCSGACGHWFKSAECMCCKASSDVYPKTAYDEVAWINPLASALESNIGRENLIANPAGALQTGNAQNAFLMPPGDGSRLKVDSTKYQLNAVPPVLDLPFTKRLLDLNKIQLKAIPAVLNRPLITNRQPRQRLSTGPTIAYGRDMNTVNNLGAWSVGAQNTGGDITYPPLTVPSSNMNNTRRVTLHYTNWCGYCKKMKPVWDQVKKASAGSGIIFSEVDEDIAKTPGVNGYPTIIMLDERGQRSKYIGQADFATLRNWIVAPVSISIDKW
jgi:thiol-disulfide isomerase/thioredoxin